MSCPGSPAPPHRADTGRGHSPSRCASWSPAAPPAACSTGYSIRWDVLPVSNPTTAQTRLPRGLNTIYSKPHALCPYLGYCSLPHLLPWLTPHHSFTHRYRLSTYDVSGIGIIYCSKQARDQTWSLLSWNLCSVKGESPEISKPAN